MTSAGSSRMKILAIIGSPKGKGAGYRIVKIIERTMAGLGRVEFEYLFLKEANLRLCTGCYVCMARGEEKCPLKDDRDTIEKKLREADGIVLSSPMYVRNVNGLMKNFIDRFAYTDHRPLFYRQKVLTVVNTGGGHPKSALRVLRNALGGSRIIHELGVLTPPWPQTPEAVAKKNRAIEAAAKKLYRVCLDTSPPTPTLNRYIHYLLMRKLSLVCRQFFPADYAFYQAKPFYLGARMNPAKAALAKVVAEMGKRIYISKGMGPGTVPWPPNPSVPSERAQASAGGT